MAREKNKYGQYMTPGIIAEFMISLAHNLSENSSILEPSSGEGVFLDALKKRGLKKITSYEIDKSIIPNPKSTTNESFVSAQINEQFDLIIGNPPYIRWKNLEPELKDELAKNPLWLKHCNSLCDYSAIFIIKSIELLKDEGQLIFITPEYWLNTTHSTPLRNYILDNGYFEEIYHFNETPIFEKASVSTVIFKFIKSKNTKNKRIKIAKYFKNKKMDEGILTTLKNRIKHPDTSYIDRQQFKKNTNWILAEEETILNLKSFERKCQKEAFVNLTPNNFYTLGEFCDIGNGMVSGLDKAFQIDTSTLNERERGHLIKVIKAKDLNPFTYNKTTDYFLIHESAIESEIEFSRYYPNLHKKLQEYKGQLNNRYQYNRKINFWEWSFLRNYRLFNQKQGRIFVPSKDRISNRNHFRFSLIEDEIYPTQDVTAIFPKKDTQESIYYILALLNSKNVFNWLKFNGVLKGSIVEFSEKPLASIPYRKINFNNNSERKSHEKISSLTKKYIETKEIIHLNEISIEFNNLFNN